MLVDAVNERGLHGAENRFRKARAIELRRRIRATRDRLGRDIRVVDVGGRPDYWGNVGIDNIESVEIINHKEKELAPAVPDGLPAERFTCRIGDARDLSDYADGSVDFVHSNSVIEHVGRWRDMQQMAAELRRVGLAGWVQTPAWGFPVEPHYMAPFLHWFGAPLRARMMSLSIRRDLRRLDLARRRNKVDFINLLGRQEVRLLFPGCDIFIERFCLLAKSYSACWLPGQGSIEPTGHAAAA